MGQVMTKALEVRQLSKTFGGGTTMLGRKLPSVHAINSVSFNLNEGETLGIVGESGCGKSTLARMLVGLLEPTSGSIKFDGTDHSEATASQAGFGRLIQYVFQDPISSLNPRKTIRQIMDAPLIHLFGMEETERNNRINELFEAVNLRSEFLERYPHEFSGGQAQRIGIARALAASPKILILDEPVSALDVSVQAQVLNLLADLREQFQLSYLFISHDLAVVEAVCDRVAVLYFGTIVEMAETREIFSHTQHPYTRLLFDSVPSRESMADDTRAIGELPDPLNPPGGCAFADRCNRVQEQCRRSKPSLRTTRLDHETACFHPIDQD